MDNSQLSVVDTHIIRNVESVLDDIIQITKREGQVESSQEANDCIALLEKYKQLETLKIQLNGRFLLEYDEGVKTLLREVRIDV